MSPQLFAPKFKVKCIDDNYAVLSLYDFPGGHIIKGEIYSVLQVDNGYFLTGKPLYYNGTDLGWATKRFERV